MALRKVAEIDAAISGIIARSSLNHNDQQKLLGLIEKRAECGCTRRHAPLTHQERDARISELTRKSLTEGLDEHEHYEWINLREIASARLRRPLPILRRDLR